MHGLLSPGEELELVVMMKKGSQAARHKIIERHLPLVHKIASNFNTHFSRMELVSAGTVGLIEAVDNFNPEYNVRIYQYSPKWIRRQIVDEIIAMGVPATVTKYVQNLSAIIKKEAAASPGTSLEDAAASLNLSRKQIATILCYDAVQTVQYDVEKEIYDDALYEFDQLEQLQNSILLLTNREQLVIRKRFYRGHTLKETGEIIGITPQAVKKIQDKAIMKLRHLLNKSPYSKTVSDRSSGAGDNTHSKNRVAQTCMASPSF